VASGRAQPQRRHRRHRCDLPAAGCRARPAGRGPVAPSAPPRAGVQIWRARPRHARTY